ncbi:MAG: PspA/IM30 family protein [Candidatus Poribacteria bacterium]|nr:PspA/IM30 family protein [Candidatus Poribacteria bacterium]
MEFVEITGKKFRLGSRFARLFASFIDGMLLASILLALFLLLAAVSPGFVQIGLLSALLWILGPKTKLPRNVLVVAQLLLVFLFGPWGHNNPETLAQSGTALWIAGMFLMDGFKNGQGLGKKLLSLQVLRLKDGKPCTFKDSFIRRLTGVFQPLDFLWTLGKNRQRMGDKLAETVVVKYEPEREQIEVETEDPERVLESVIVEMKNRLAEAREKVNASIGVEKQFQDAYENAVSQAERWQERAIISLEAGREDLAREDLEKRNEYRRLANQYKNQWEDQKQMVRNLNDLLEHFQQKMMEAEGEKAAVVAKHRNVDAEVHLREMLKEIQNSKALETLVQMDQNATEAATLAKAAAEVDVPYQDMKLEREFSSYAEEALIDKDIAELKTKLQKR